MSAQHTPGPWQVETVETSCGICHKIGPFPWKNGKQNHACIYADYPGTGPTTKELEANATLIAAAPDLLEVLQSLLSEYEDRKSQWGDEYLWDKHEDKEVMEAVRAAIKKAKGELQ